MRHKVLDFIIKTAEMRHPGFRNEIVSYNSINEEHAKLLRDVLSNLSEEMQAGYRMELEYIKNHQAPTIYYYICSLIEII